MKAVDFHKYRFKVSNIFKTLLPTLNKGFRSYGVCLIEFGTFIVFGIYCGGYFYNQDYHEGMYSIVVSVIYITGVWIHVLGVHYNSRHLLLIHCYTCFLLSIYQLFLLISIVLLELYFNLLLQQPHIRRIFLLTGMQMTCSIVLGLIFGMSSYIRAREVRDFKMFRKRILFTLTTFDAYLTSSMNHNLPKYAVRYAH
ncbi:unnamed protein product [Bursaphelenchus okinawaensis]|uniref:Uncharacterized protein n=1 Tax=Bursaphelenchus okinawaensis TaxID=465554 RepID=A0A811K824_9BILA|nr:unnamed protein product [Bursaphelenchus okinawaensis]CAG9093560.1 unnamed protein product [Bursaphelenchus okinawaensis]